MQTRRSDTIPGSWTTMQIVACLAPRAAMAAMGGKPQPVTAAVVAKLERIVREGSK